MQLLPPHLVLFASGLKEFKPSFSNTEVLCVSNSLWKKGADRSGLSSASTDLHGHLDLQKAKLWQWFVYRGPIQNMLVF